MKLESNPLFEATLAALRHNLRKSIHISPQNGDTAVIIAVKRHDPVTLRELVRVGSDLNLQNQVRYTATVDTAPHTIPSLPY